MRGQAEGQLVMIHAICLEERISRDHPLRAVKGLTDEILGAMGDIFAKMFSERGRPSVPPEQVLKATLLMALYTIRSDRQFCEHLEYNLLFRWFLDMGLEVPVFDHSVFTYQRERLINHEVGQTFLMAVVERARQAGLVSSDHFTVDGTLVEAWASLKSFRRRDDPRPPSSDDDDKGNPSVNFHGEKRSNETHASTTDPEAKLMRKGNGKEAKLCFGGHVLMENRNGLVVDATVTEATGTCEREAALDLLQLNVEAGRRVTLAGDKGYDTHGFVADLRAINATPHVAANTGRRGGSAIDGRTMRHAGYEVSQVIRKRVEEIFGWMKTVGGMRKTRVKGVRKTNFLFQMAAAAYNLLRMANLLAVASR